MLEREGGMSLLTYENHEKASAGKSLNDNKMKLIFKRKTIDILVVESLEGAHFPFQ